SPPPAGNTGRTPRRCGCRSRARPRTVRAKPGSRAGCFPVVSESPLGLRSFDDVDGEALQCFVPALALGVGAGLVISLDGEPGALPERPVGPLVDDFDVDRDLH